MTHPLFVAILFGGGLAVVGGGAARATLIVNGSFEQPVLAPGSWSTFSNGAVPGWTSNNNEIEIDTPQAIGLARAAAGGQSLELDGSTFDTVSQLVTGLTVGQQYVLQWAYSGRQGSGNQQADVSFDGTLLATDVNNGLGPMTWAYNDVVVTARSGTAVLSFAAVDVGGSRSVGNEIDDVSLVAVPVPEPGTLAVVGGAWAWLSIIRQRSRALRQSTLVCS